MAFLVSIIGSDADWMIANRHTDPLVDLLKNHCSDMSITERFEVATIFHGIELDRNKPEDQLLSQALIAALESEKIFSLEPKLRAHYIELQKLLCREMLN